MPQQTSRTYRVAHVGTGYTGSLALRQVLRDINTRCLRLESDVKMVLAGQSTPALNLAQHSANDGAQGLLHDLVVGNQAIGHSTFGHGACPERVARDGQAPVASRCVGAPARYEGGAYRRP